MGMGYGANYVEYISNEEVEKLCPEEYKAFMEVFSTSETISFEDFAKQDANINSNLEEGIKRLCKDYCVDSDAERKESEALISTYTALRTAFERRTTVGDSCLKLFVGFHDEDCGDRYDDISGPFFCVTGVCQLSPAGNKFGNLVERKFFVVFG